MKRVIDLIDEARALCQSDADLARRVNLDPADLANIRAGKRTPSPILIGRLCDLLQLPGDDARRWLAVAVIEKAMKEGKPELADVLRRAFFVLWACGVGLLTATVSTDAKARTVAYTPQTSGNATVRLTDWRYLSVTDPLYIVAHWLRRAVLYFVARYAATAGPGLYART